MGDFNAKIGRGTEESVIGQFGLGERNEVGDKLAHFCSELTIGNTWYKLPKRRLYTWVSPDQNIRNQIDFILCQLRWRNSLISAKTRPGVDSDHQLLVGKLRIRLKKTKRDFLPVRCDMGHISNEFAVAVKNRFQALELLEEDKSPDELWTGIRDILCEGIKAHVPNKQKRNKTP